MLLIAAPRNVTVGFIVLLSNIDVNMTTDTNLKLAKYIFLAQAHRGCIDTYK
jgi:hypothetical protein